MPLINNLERKLIPKIIFLNLSRNYPDSPAKNWLDYKKKSLQAVKNLRLELRLLDIERTAYSSSTSIDISGGKEGEVIERTTKELFDKLEVNENERKMLIYDFLEDKTHRDALRLSWLLAKI